MMRKKRRNRRIVSLVMMTNGQISSIWIWMTRTRS